MTGIGVTVYSTPRMKTRFPLAGFGIALLAAGCASTQFHPLAGPPAYQVSLRAVNFEREIANPEWKFLVDVAADRAGNAVVLDGSTHQAAVCDAQGRPVLSIGENGFWSKTFPRPSGVAVDAEGRIYISDAKNESIKIFDRTGAYASKIGEKGYGPGQFRDAAGIDVDAAGTLHAVDRGNLRVQKFDARGILVGQIASGPKVIDKIDISRTAGPIQFIAWPRFTRPRDIATGLDGMTYLLDEGTRAVHAYNPQGAYLFSFGGRGKGRGRFEKPAGIAVGADGIVCVSDEKNDTVQFFDPQGRFLTSVGGRGTGRGQFREPQGIGTTPDGLVFVADRGNRRVQVFSCVVPRPQEAPAAARIDKPVRIAIFDFKNNNPQARARGYGETISEMFITAFARRATFEVVERKQLRKLIDELYLDQSGVVDEETTKKLGKVLGVDIALAGGVSLFAGGIEIDLRLLDIETGKVVIPDAIKTAAESQLRALVDREVLRLEGAYLVRFCAPAPPVGLTVSGGIREATLSWKAGTEPDLRGYRVYRAPAEGGPYTLVAKTQKPQWQDRELSDGTACFYRVTAVDADGKESRQGPAGSANTRAKPVAGELEVRPQAQVRKSSFSWTENEQDVTGYVIYRASSPGGAYTKAGESRTPNFSEKGFGDGETHYYKVAKKYRNGLESEPSKEFAAGTKPRPSVPEGLSAASGLARRVRLEWADPREKDIREFRVYRSDSESGDYTKIASVKPGWISSPSHADTGLKDDTPYWYRVETIDADGLASPMSSPVKATTKPAPAAPRGLRAETGRARSVPLSWERNPEKDVSAYRVFSSESEGGPFTQIAETADPSFVHTGLKDVATRHYRVFAVDRDGLLSGFSSIASATTKPSPTRPTGLKAASGLARSVRLDWAPNPERDIVQHTIFRREGEKGSFAEVGEARNKLAGHTDTGLGDGKRYQYEIRAVDAEGLVSEPSERAEATTKPRPSPPGNLRAEARDGLIAVSWTASPDPDIAAYEIYRRSGWNPLGGEEKVGQVASTSFEDRTAPAGSACTYRVAALDAAGLRSEKSGTAAAAMPE